MGQAENGAIPPGLPCTPTYWTFSPENSIYGGLIPVAKWRLIIFPFDHRKTPNNERWSPISLYSCPLRDTLTIEQYPAVRGFLTQFKRRLTPGVKGGRKPGNYEWCEIQDTIDYFPEFEKPKIIWPDIAKRCEFAFDNQGLYPDCTLFIIPDTDHCLVGILNSAVVDWFYRNVSPTIQQDFLRFKRIYLSQIPIPQAAIAQSAAIESLVRKLLDAGGQGPQVEVWERELNALVYQVYGLTDEEIAIVEKQR